MFGLIALAGTKEHSRFHPDNITEALFNHARNNVVPQLARPMTRIERRRAKNARRK
jgi:hypothetical protein